MSVYSGPEIVNSGLVVHLDAANPNSYKNYNIATYSQNFDNAVWSKSTGLITATGLLAPDNTFTAFTVTDDLTDAYENFSRTFTVLNDSSTYNISIFIKKTTGATSSRTGLNVNLTGGTAVNTQPRFNADTGILVGSPTNNMVVTSENNNYWRISFTVTNNGTGNTSLSIQYYPATGPYNSGDLNTATGSHTVWGFQLSLGATLLPYKQNVLDSTIALLDLSGNGNNFTLGNGPAYSSVNKGSILFDGVNDFCVSNSVLSVSTTAVTASSWVRVAAHGNFHNFILNNWVNNGWLLFSYNTHWVFGVGRTNTQQFNAQVLHNNSTNWTQLTGTYDGAAVRLYVNGVLGATVTLVGATLDVGFAINTGVGTRPSAYNISNTLIYNRALTAAEVAQNFEATRGRYGI